MRKMTLENLEMEARHLIKLNHSEVPSIVQSFIFPDVSGKEIRVIHVDKLWFPEDAIVPIQFSPDPQEGLHHTMQIAVTDLTGPERLNPPPEWGTWESAIPVERIRRRKAS